MLTLVGIRLLEGMIVSLIINRLLDLARVLILIGERGGISLHE